MHKLIDCANVYCTAGEMVSALAIVGLSILSGAHLALTTRTIEALRAADAADIAVVVGGTIPEADGPKLLAVGAAAVFPTGTPLDVLVREIRTLTGSNPEPDLKGTAEPCVSE